MVKVRLNENHVNEFLTTHTGYVFYRKHNGLNKEMNIVDVKPNDTEVLNLISQGVLIIVGDEEKMQEPEKIPTIKENTPKDRLDASLKTTPSEQPKEKSDYTEVDENLIL